MPFRCEGDHAVSGIQNWLRAAVVLLQRQYGRAGGEDAQATLGGRIRVASKTTKKPRRLESASAFSLIQNSSVFIRQGWLRMKL